jgi:hypothetical protein
MLMGRDESSGPRVGVGFVEERVFICGECSREVKEVWCSCGVERTPNFFFSWTIALPGPTIVEGSLPLVIGPLATAGSPDF